MIQFNTRRYDNITCDMFMTTSLVICFPGFYCHLVKYLCGLPKAQDNQICICFCHCSVLPSAIEDYLRLKMIRSVSVCVTVITVFSLAI